MNSRALNIHSVGRLVFLMALLWAVLLTQPTRAASLNGFDLSRSLVPVDEILSGGPPRDGIPAIDHPRFASAREAAFLSPEDRVLGIRYNGAAKAYPIRILNWHEIVNDRLGDLYFAVSYCPLCGTGVAFRTGEGRQARSFGVSGLLYNSDVLLYDRETASLWSQIMGRAVSGELAGTRLELIPLEHTSWQSWRERHPQSLVLFTDTGFSRDYDRDPYAGYERSRQLYFSVANEAPPNYHPKERVMGLEAGGQFKAYPFVELNREGHASFEDQIGGKRYTILWNRHHQSGRILDENGDEIPSITGFWFAWFAFHPDTLVFEARK